MLFLHAAPFVAAAGEHFLLAGHRLSGGRILGLVAAFIGLAIALGDGLTPRPGASFNGDVLCLLGGIAWGLTTVVLKTTKLRQVPAEKALLYQIWTSVPLLFGWSIVTGEAGLYAVTPPVVWAFFYTVFLVVVFGYTTWFWMLKTYSAASLHAFTFLTPIFGILAGHLILGESIGLATGLGFLLVTAGIYLVNRPARVAKAPTVTAPTATGPTRDWPLNEGNRTTTLSGARTRRRLHGDDSRLAAPHGDAIDQRRRNLLACLDQQDAGEGGPHTATEPLEGGCPAEQEAPVDGGPDRALIPNRTA